MRETRCGEEGRACPDADPLGGHAKANVSRVKGPGLFQGQRRELPPRPRPTSLGPPQVPLSTPQTTAKS